MGLTVHTRYSAEIDELCNRHNCFSYLKNSTFSINESNSWTMNSSHWGYVDEYIHELQVMFIGKTGYGKSTTLNKIVGKNVLKQMMSVFVRKICIMQLIGYVQKRRHFYL